MISSLKTADDEEITAVFNELITHDSLIADYNACYVIKALFDATQKDEQRTQILQRLRMQFRNVAASVCGSDLILSVLQKMPQEGVFQKLTNRRAKKAAFDTKMDNTLVFSLARHHVGHRVVVAVIKYFQIEDKYRLMREMLPFVEKMAQDQTGQSVLQISLENSTPDLKSQIIKTLSDDFLRLSQQKIARLIFCQ
uniref:PUM-HD domain-containing protein n=1 Tax=Romanomermis culicivorax TaxID=13658 RepID=A0A915J6V3_ROMCU